MCFTFINKKNTANKYIIYKNSQAQSVLEELAKEYKDTEGWVQKYRHVV
jgi:hypothetical protein